MSKCPAYIESDGYSMVVIAVQKRIWPSRGLGTDARARKARRPPLRVCMSAEDAVCTRRFL